MSESGRLTGTATSRVRISRRQFGKLAGALLASCVLFNEKVQLSNAEAPAAGLDKRAFTACIGQSFRVYSSSPKPVEVVLAEVSDLGQGGGSAGECFSVLFRGPIDRPLQQDTYRFEQRRIGSFPLFIVPGSTSNGAQHYVAIFNRLS